MNFQKIETLGVEIDPILLKGLNVKGETIPLRKMELLLLRTTVEAVYENTGLDLSNASVAEDIRLRVNRAIIETDTCLVRDTEVLTPNSFRVLKNGIRNKYGEQASPKLKTKRR